MILTLNDERIAQLDERLRLALQQHYELAGNALLADAERRRRNAEGEPILALSLSADVASNPLLRDAERRCA